MPTGKPYKPNEADRLKLTHGLEFGLSLMFIAEAMSIAVNSLKKHYPDVIEAAELKGGNSFKPTKDQRGLVKLAAAVGQPHEDIAQLLGISRNTLRRHFAEELETGAALANFKVGQNLFAMATGDPTLRSTLIAAIWWSKCRMGWRSPPVAGQTSIYGPKSQAQVVVLPQEQDRCDDDSAPSLSDQDVGLPPDSEPTPTGGDPCEEALNIELYRAHASHWHEVAATASDMTWHAAFIQAALAFEKLAFLATEPANAAISGPKRKSSARR